MKKYGTILDRIIVPPQLYCFVILLLKDILVLMLDWIKDNILALGAAGLTLSVALTVMIYKIKNKNNSSIKQTAVGTNPSNTVTIEGDKKDGIGSNG